MALALAYFTLETLSLDEFALFVFKLFLSFAHVLTSSFSRFALV